MAELFQERPSLVKLLVTALRHGGPDAGEFVFGIARTLDQSPLIEPLYEFATGQRGSQKLRTDILSWLGSNNLLSQTVHRMWLDGEWRNIKTFRNEIYDEPTTPHTPEVRDKGAQAFYLIRDNPAEAERMLREALELEPDAPDLLNNLAMALQGQGKRAEATGSCTTCNSVSQITFSARLRWLKSRSTDATTTLCEDPGRAHRTAPAARFGVCRRRGLLCPFGRGGRRHPRARMWLTRIADMYPDYSELPVFRKIIELAKKAQAVEGLGRPNRSWRQR